MIDVSSPSTGALSDTPAKLAFNCSSASLGAGNDRTFAAERIPSLHSQHPAGATPTPVLLTPLHSPAPACTGQQMKGHAMKKLLITTAMLIAFAFTNAHAETEAQSFSAFAARQQEYRQEVNSEINAACARKWSTNYEMQLYCRTKQTDAFEAYLRMMTKAVNWLQTTNDSSARVWAGIISDCVNK
jgi:hypothetical protein